MYNNRVGIIPNSSNFQHPGDRRRFIYFCNKRNINYEIASFEKKYDAVFLTQASDLTLWRNYNLSPIVFDFTDSYLNDTFFRNYLRGLGKFLFRKNKYFIFNYKNLLKEMCSKSYAVICTTKEQSNQIKKYNKNVHIILDSRVELSEIIKTNYVSNDNFKFLWEGFPENAQTFKILVNVFKKVKQFYNIELHVISDKTYPKYLSNLFRGDTLLLLKKVLNFKEIYLYEWSIPNMKILINNCDLALIPLLNHPMYLGKPENKLLIFWQMGIPVLCSNSPAYKNATDKGEIDIICHNDNDWYNKIIKMIENEVHRLESARLGKLIVNTFYNDNNLLVQWDDIFTPLLNKK